MMKMFLTFWIIFTIPYSYAHGAYFIFVIFTLTIVASIGFGQLLGLSDKRYLQGFLKRTLNAHQIEKDKTEMPA
jgi:hypothetical protein